MEPNFYENIVSKENKEQKELIKKMSKLLDDSLDSFIELRKRQKNEKVNIIKIESKPGKASIFADLFSMLPRINANDNSTSTRRIFNRNERLERIRNMQEETENLERMIENDIEIVG